MQSEQFNPNPPTLKNMSLPKISRAEQMCSLAKNFAKIGVSCVPVGPNKLPDAQRLIAAGFRKDDGRSQWKTLQTRQPRADECDALFPADFTGNIAVAAGNVFCIDIDEKYNHLSEDKSLLVLLRDRCYASGLGAEFDGAILAKTPSGGAHLIFRCEDADAGNEKLAWVANPLAGQPTADGKGVQPQTLCTYETRGHGGYFLVAPSAGYELQLGLASEPRPTLWSQMPTYTIAQKNALLDVCRSFNQVVKKSKEQPKEAKTVAAGNGDSPGDHFNAACRANPSMIATLLESNGWECVQDHLWRRPGKAEGVSATYNSPDVGGNAAFYCFSSSTNFEAETIYQPWHTYAVLECGGDFAQAASELRAAGFGGKKEAPGKAPTTTTTAPTSTPAAEDSDNPFAGMNLGNILPQGDEIVEGSDEWWEQGGEALSHMAWSTMDATDLDTPPVIIDGLLLRGGACMLAAPSKACKSWTLIDIALSVASGTSWAGMECEKNKVLYINFELLASKFKERVGKIAAEREMPVTDNLIVLNMRDSEDMSLKTLKRSIVALCKKEDIGLVIVDPIYLPMIDEHLDENLVGDVAGFLKQLRQIGVRGNAAVLYAHHFAKGDSTLKEVGDRGAGSGAFGRYVDCQIVLTPPPFGGEYSESNTGRRYMSLEIVQRDFKPFRPRVLQWKFPRWANTSISMPEFAQKPKRSSAKK